MYYKQVKPTFTENLKFFASIFAENIRAILKRERPSFKKYHTSAWTRQVCRENGLDKTGYENA